MQVLQETCADQLMSEIGPQKCIKIWFANIDQRQFTSPTFGAKLNKEQKSFPSAECFPLLYPVFECSPNFANYTVFIRIECLNILFE